MHNKPEQLNQIKDVLNQKDMIYILASALSHRNLAKMVNKLKLNSRDMKTTQIPTKELAGILAEGIFTDPNIFKEVKGALDLYSAEAVKAVNKGNIGEFRNTMLKDKGHRAKTDMARLVWALVTDRSSENVKEGKRLISELAYQNKHVDSDRTDTTDGEKIEDKNRSDRMKRREQNLGNKRKPIKSVHPNFEPEISKLKNQIEELKKKNTKLHQQLQQSRDPSKIKTMGSKIRQLMQENREMKERINKEYLPREEFDALKKETDRLYQLYKNSNKSYRKGITENQDHLLGHVSVWEQIKTGLNKCNPFSKRPRFLRRGKNCRVGIFVDVQNMFYSAKNLYHGRLDFEKFLELALHGRKLVQATAYIVKTPEIDQSKFINLLKNNEYVVKTIDLKTGMNGFAKGNWDVGMVMDIFELADKMDVIALASGDGDFVPLVKYLQKRGIRVEVYAFAYNTAIDLKECADKFYPLQENILIKDQRGMVKQH